MPLPLPLPEALVDWSRFIWDEGDVAFGDPHDRQPWKEQLANDCHAPDSGRFCETPGAPGHEGHGTVPGEGNVNAVERDQNWFYGPEEIRGSTMWPDGIRPIADQYAKDVTEDEWQALRAYTTNDYRYVNRRLDDPNGYNAEPEYADGQIKLIDSALEKAPTFPEPIEVFRGVAMPGMSQKDVKAYIDRTYKAGDVISMSQGGYQSTSLGVEAPLDQTLSQTNNGWIFEVKAKRGAPLMGSTTYLDESEVLISRHDKFRVVAVHHDVPFVKGVNMDETTRSIVQVEQI